MEPFSRASSHSGGRPGGAGGLGRLSARDRKGAPMACRSTRVGPLAAERRTACAGGVRWLSAASRPSTPPAAGEAILTFWLGDEGSWLWVWTGAGLRFTSLPGRRTILAAAESFRLAIAADSTAADPQGERLLRLLLGDLRATALAAG